LPQGEAKRTRGAIFIRSEGWGAKRERSPGGASELKPVAAPHPRRGKGLPHQGARPRGGSRGASGSPCLVAVAFCGRDTLGRGPQKAYCHFAWPGAFQPPAPRVDAFGCYWWLVFFLTLIHKWFITNNFDKSENVALEWQTKIKAGNNW